MAQQLQGYRRTRQREYMGEDVTLDWNRRIVRTCTWLPTVRTRMFIRRNDAGGWHLRHWQHSTGRSWRLWTGTTWWVL